jgi:hypothetical protein
MTDNNDTANETNGSAAVSQTPAFAFEIVADLLRVAANPLKTKSRLAALADAEAAAAAAQSQLEADRAAFERLQVTSLAEIAEKRQAAVAIWARATRLEQDLAAREKRCIEREAEAGLTGALMPVAVGPAGGLTMPPDAAAVMAARDRLRRMGPDGQPFPEGTTITRELGPGELESTLAHDAARISRQRRQRGVRIGEL